MAQLTRAYFETVEVGTDHPAARQRYEVQFNPETYVLSKSAEWAENGADHTLDLPLVEWRGGRAMRLEMSLSFDTTDDGTDVRTHTQPIEELSMVNDERHGPPILQFHWDGPLSHRGGKNLCWVLVGFETTYKHFTHEGVPVRAEMRVSLSEFATQQQQLDRIRLQSPDHEKTWTVRPGDTLDRIAARVYEDPAAWRPIALANNIEDPLRLRAGQVLRVPRTR